MKKSETLEDLFAKINDVAKDYEWSEDKPDTMFWIGFNEDHVIHKYVGHLQNVAVALVNSMLQDEDVKRIVFAAYDAYKHESAMALESMIKQMHQGAPVTKAEKVKRRLS